MLNARLGFSATMRTVHWEAIASAPQFSDQRHKLTTVVRRSYLWNPNNAQEWIWHEHFRRRHAAQDPATQVLHPYRLQKRSYINIANILNAG
jgi:ribosomal protein S12 methylthiotransferase accessory factor YcaO